MWPSGRLLKRTRVSMFEVRRSNPRWKILAGMFLSWIRNMAKKTSKASGKVTLKSKDKKNLGSIGGLADEVVQAAERGRAPYVEIPSRSLSNVRFNQSKRIIEMGSGTGRRELFNLSQARSYMQTLLVGSGCKQLIEQGKT